MIACFLSNNSAKYYKNSSMLSPVIAKNVEDVFFETQCINITVLLALNYSCHFVVWWHYSYVTAYILIMISAAYFLLVAITYPGLAVWADELEDRGLHHCKYTCQQNSFLSALEVWSRQGAIQIHVYLYHDLFQQIIDLTHSSYLADWILREATKPCLVWFC